MYGGVTFEIVEPGTVRKCPLTGIEMTIDDGAAVIDQRNGIAWVTRHTYDLIKELAAPAGTDGAA